MRLLLISMAFLLRAMMAAPIQETSKILEKRQVITIFLLIHP
jgi:hypothetical protein